MLRFLVSLALIAIGALCGIVWFALTARFRVSKGN